jgi:hypothetical protein
LLAGSAPAHKTDCGSSGSGYSSAVLATQGLAAYYRLDEATGSVACDLKGYADGVYMGMYRPGAAGALADDPDPAAEFLGLGTVRIGSTGSLDHPANALTLEAWVKPATAAQSETVLRKDGEYLLRLTNGSVYFRVWTSTGIFQLVSPRVLQPAAYQHLVAVFDGTTMTLYRNGSSLASQPADGDLRSTGNALYLGASGGYYDFYTGVQDEVAIYGSALAPGAVLDHYTAARGTQTEPPPPPPPPPPSDITAPTAPGPLTGQLLTGPAVTLSWGAATDDVGVAGYRVYRSAVGLGNTASTAYVDGAPPAGSTVSYAVRAYDAAGNLGPASDPFTVTIPEAAALPPPPPPPPPPDGVDACGWGTFSSTLRIWPGSCWRPYAATSPFNKPIPANPTVRSESDAVISTLLASGNGPGNLTAGGPSSDDYEHPVVYSQLLDPEYTIHCVRYACDDLEGKRVRIPVGARPAGGSDGHLAVVDQASGLEYDLYEASTPGGSGGTLEVGSGGVSRIDGTGLSTDLDGDGSISEATAAKFGLLAGIVRAEELAAGQINHALFITVPCGAQSPAYVAPALKGGTFCADNTNRVPMGARLWLNMSDAEIDALTIPTWKKTILHAFHTYGAYMGDTGGPQSFGIMLESDATYSSFGTTSRMMDFARSNGWEIYNGYYVGHLRDGVPWSRLQVLEWNDPANH